MGTFNKKLQKIAETNASCYGNTLLFETFSIFWCSLASLELQGICSGFFSSKPIEETSLYSILIARTHPSHDSMKAIAS
jgi:hypothetical protein